MLMYDKELARVVWRRKPEGGKLLFLMNDPFSPPGSSFTTIGL